jgi:hypothetical protein
MSRIVEIVYADGTVGTMTIVKRPRQIKVKKTYHLPEGVWDIVKEYAGISVKYTNVQFGTMDIAEIEDLFYKWMDKKDKKYVDRIVQDDNWCGADMEVKFRKVNIDERYKNGFGSGMSLWTFDLPKYNKYKKQSFTLYLMNKCRVRGFDGVLLDWTLDYFVDELPMEKVPTYTILPTLPVKYAKQYAPVLFLKA